jgi:hypothetical protein
MYVCSETLWRSSPFRSYILQYAQHTHQRQIFEYQTLFLGALTIRPSTHRSHYISTQTKRSPNKPYAVTIY